MKKKAHFFKKTKKQSINLQKNCFGINKKEANIAVH